METKQESPSAEDPIISSAAQPKDETATTAPIEERNTEPLADEDDNTTYLEGFKLHLLASGLILVGFLVTLSASVVVTAIPRITSDFHSIEDIGWYGSAYLLANCSVQPITGKLYSLYSLKYTFLVFLAVFELGSLLCGVSPSSNLFILGRAVAGVGCAGLINGALNILSSAAPLEKRPILISLVISVSTIGSITGPLVGGALTDAISWRWCFYLSLPLGGIAGVLLFFMPIPDPRVQSELKPTLWQRIQQFDPFGILTFTPAVIMCLLALDWGGSTYNWNSATILSLLCGSCVAFCIFVYSQYRNRQHAMVPLDILSQRIVYCSFLTVVFQRGGLFLLIYYVPLWFQAVKSATPTLSGVYILPTILSQIFAATGAGWAVGRLGYYLPWAIVGGALTSCGSGLMSLFTPSSRPAMWISFQIIVGIGRGMSLQQPISAIQSILPAAQTPLGTSLLMFANYFGGAIFVSFGKTLFSSTLISALRESAAGVNVQEIIDAGPAEITSTVGEKDLPGVLIAWNASVVRVFYLAAAASVVSFFTSWGLGWRRVVKKKAHGGTTKRAEKEP